MMYRSVVSLAAVLIVQSLIAPNVNAKPDLGEMIRAALDEGQSPQREYEGEAFAAIQALLEEEPEQGLLSLKAYIKDSELIERVIALDILRYADLHAYEIALIVIPEVDYSDKDDVKATQRLIRRKLPMEADGPDYSVISTVLPGALPEQQRQIVRWLYQDGLFQAIDGVAASMTDEYREWEPYRSTIYHAKVLEESVWREGRAFIPKDSMTPEASISLDALLQANEWWVRLAGAVAMGHFEYMRSEDRIAMLEDEQDPVLLEVIEHFGLKID